MKKPSFFFLLAALALYSCFLPVVGYAQKAVSLQVVDELDLPCPVDSLNPLPHPEVSLAVGEYEAVAVLVTSSRPLEKEKFSVSGLPQNVGLEIREVVPYTRKLRGNREITTPFLLEAAQEVSLDQPGAKLYWLTFHAGDNSRPGSYDLSVRLGDDAAGLKMNLHPYRLRRSPDFFFGAFCGGRDRTITPAYLKDLHERGFDALQFFWGSVSVGLQNDQGVLKADFSRVDEWMEDFKAAGMKGPVVWSMGNDATSHMENDISRLFGLPLAPSKTVDGKTTRFSDVNNPELNRHLKELMLAIKSHAREKNWPEIVFIIYDEPTERLMEEHENRYKFLKSFWPELRIYGVTMDRIEWARAVSHMVDIFVANGDFAEIRKLATSQNKPFWLYGSASGQDAASLRHRYAWSAWSHDAESSWFWAYNYYRSQSYADSDGGAKSGASMVWPSRTPDGPLVFSVSWDGMREAADDIAYIQTLEWMLEQSQSRNAAKIRARLQEIKSSLPSGQLVRVLDGDAHDRVEVVSSRKYVRDYRKWVADSIEDLLEQEKSLFGEIRVR